MKIREKLEDETKRLVIALDGPAASGKGTIGELLAAKYNLQYFQSSLTYRGLAWLCLQENITPDEFQSVIKLSADAKLLIKIPQHALFGEDVASYASKIAVIPEVRDNLTAILKDIIKNTNRIIMEGRDIGTVVAPDADFKIYLTASVEARAARRYKQLQEKGKECMIGDILNQILERDKVDSQRKTSPLRPAENAVIIDTSCLSTQEVIDKIDSYKIVVPRNMY